METKEESIGFEIRVFVSKMVDYNLPTIKVMTKDYVNLTYSQP